LGFLVFRCHGTGKRFRSNFKATTEELQSLPPRTAMELRCDVCGQRHRFDLAQCSIEED
jgi:hypothetical protein